MKRVNKIVLKRIPDYDADTSWIGEFNSEGIPAGRYGVDREERGDMRHGEHRYFVSTNAENQKQADEDYKHMRQIDDGSISFYGVRADAECALSEDGKTWTLYTITSGGLWGMEYSGAKEDEKYFEEEEKNQLEELRDLLKLDGYTAEAINAAPVVKEDK